MNIQAYTKRALASAAYQPPRSFFKNYTILNHTSQKPRKN